MAPSHADPVVRAASQVIGGPAGRRLASARRPWAAVPLLVLMAVAVLSAGVIEKEHCRAQGWSSPDQFWHACYSDIPVVYGSSGLGDAGGLSFAEALGPAGVGQPPLASALMWLVSAFVPGGQSDSPRIFFDLSVLVLAALLATAVVAVAVAAGRRRWDAAHLAASPLLVTAALISYQLLGVTLLAVALLAWSRGRCLVAGVCLGLGCAAAPQVAAVGVAAVIVTAASGRAAPGLRFAGAALVTWLAVRAILLTDVTAGLPDAWRSWRTSAPGYGSIWLVPQLIDGIALQRPRGWPRVLAAVDPLTGTTASALSLAGLAVLVAGVAIWVWWLPAGALPSFPGRHAVGGSGVGSGPAPVPVTTLARVSLVVLGGVLVLSTSLPVQASLLVLPLIALSGLPWRDHLIWVSTELVYFVGVWLYIGGQSQADRGLPGGFYLVLLTVRLSGISWLAARSAWLLRHPGAADELPGDEPRDRRLVEAFDPRMPWERST